MNIILKRRPNLCIQLTKNRKAFLLVNLLLIISCSNEANESVTAISADTAITPGTVSSSSDILQQQILPHIYLLTGQSNMVGWSELGAKQAGSGEIDAVHPQIFQLNVTPNDRTLYRATSAFSDETINTSLPLFIAAEDPLHEPLLPEELSKSGTTVGPGLSFAKAALADTDQPIYLVPAAFGGTGFCAGANGDLSWNAYPTDDPNLGGTGLADRALTRLNMTLRETNGVFKGILWHQGENDGINPDCAATYAENLAELVARFRSDAIVDSNGPDFRGDDANIPFILGTMARGSDERGNFSSVGVDGKAAVDAIHRDIAQIIPHSQWVNNDDLVPPAYPCGQTACYHLGADAYREMGARYYQAFKKLPQ